MFKRTNIMKNIRGLNVVVTGASSGLGKCIAFELASRGATPILIARRKDKLNEISKQIMKTYQIEVPIFVLDVTNEVEVGNVFQQIYQSIGNIDVLINNAGFGVFKSFDETSIDEERAMFDVNVFGVVACMKQVIGKMKELNTGQIINIASIAGKIATPKSSAYAASKHAVLGFTNATRMELINTNVQITTINPGPIRTNFFEIADVSGNYVKNVGNIMLDPVFVAKKVVATIGTRKREVNLPKWMGLGPILFALMPTLFEKVSAGSLNKK